MYWIYNCCAYFCFADQAAVLLGGNDIIKNDIVSYLRMIALGIPFIMAGLTINNQFRFQGNALYGMMGIVLGGVLNIILDPVFIFVFNLGVMGAGLSTSLSQFISFIFLYYLENGDDKPEDTLYKAIKHNCMHMQENRAMWLDEPDIMEILNRRKSEQVNSERAKFKSVIEKMNDYWIKNKRIISMDKDKLVSLLLIARTMYINKECCSNDDDFDEIFEDFIVNCIRKLKSSGFLRGNSANFAILKLYQEMVSITINNDISVNLVKRLSLTSPTLQRIRAENHWINGSNMRSVC